MKISLKKRLMIIPIVFSLLISNASLTQVCAATVPIINSTCTLTWLGSSKASSGYTSVVSDNNWRSAKVSIDTKTNSYDMSNVDTLEVSVSMSGTASGGQYTGPAYKMTITLETENGSIPYTQNITTSSSNRKITFPVATLVGQGFDLTKAYLHVVGSVGISSHLCTGSLSCSASDITATVTKPVLSSALADKSIEIGKEGRFTTSWSNAPTSYLWEYTTDTTSDEPESWISITEEVDNANICLVPNATELLVKPKNKNSDGWRFRCSATNEFATNTTNMATLAVVSVPPEVTSNPSDVLVKCLESASMYTSWKNNPEGFLWQSSDDGGKTWKNLSSDSSGDFEDSDIKYSGVNSQTLKIEPKTLAKDGYKYRCAAQKSGYNDVYSEGAVLTIQPISPAIAPDGDLTNDGTLSATEGDDLTCSVNFRFVDGENANGHDSYVWQYSLDPSVTGTETVSDTKWVNITEGTVLQTTESGDDLTGAVATGSIQSTTFESGVSGKTIAQSNTIVLKNARTELYSASTPTPCLYIRCVALSNISGISNTPSSKAHIIVMQAGYSEVETRARKESINIGEELDAYNYDQFMNFVHYKNSVGKRIYSRIFNSRALRFMNDSSITSLEDLQTRLANGTYGETELGTLNSPGSKTTFAKTAVAGTNILYIVVPNFNDYSNSVATAVTVSGVDLVGPTMDALSGNWLTSVEPLVLGDEYMRGVVKNTDSPIVLYATNVKDNVTSSANLSCVWYQNGSILGEGGIKQEADLSYTAYYVISGGSSLNGTYYCDITDEAGNSSRSNDYVLNAWDTTPPVLTVTITPDVNTPSTGKEVAILVEDDNIADKPIAFTTKNSADQLTEDDWSFINNYAVSDNGEYFIYGRDAAGNITQWVDPSTGFSSVVIATIDHTAPSINNVSVTPSTNPDGTPNVYDDSAAGGASGQYVKIDVDATDSDAYGNLSNQLWYKLEKDGVVIRDWQTEHVFDNIKESGNYVIYVKDIAGNIYQYSLYDLNVDSITGKLSAGELQTVFGVTITVSPASWVGKDESRGGGRVTINAIGGNESVLHPTAPFSYDGGNTWTATRYYTVTQNGQYPICIKDAYGNTYNYITIPVKNIDVTDPEFTATPSAKNSSITINATDNEDGSGLDEIYYTFNNGPKKALMTFVEGVYSGTATLTVDHLGTYTFYVVDNAGNYSTKSLDVSQAFTDNELFEGSTDEISAKITALISANPTDWTNSSVTLTFSPTSTTGFANMPYTWDGINWTNSQTYTVTQNGSYILTIKDAYGNPYSSQYIDITNIDKVAPTVSADQNGNYLSIVAKDLQSGVSRIAWVGGTVTGLTNLNVYDVGQGSAALSVELPSNGTYTIYAYDVAGNVTSFNKTVTGVTTRNATPTSTPNNGNKTNTIEKYYYYTTTEKVVPVYPTSSPTPVVSKTTVTPIPTPIVTPTPTPVVTPTPIPSNSTSTKASTVTSTTGTGMSSTATKLKTDVVAATPVTTSSVDEVSISPDENLAKYRNSRVANSISATDDTGKKRGINVVFGIVASLMALSAVAAGVYWYTTKYKPQLAENALNNDDYAFSEDIALAQDDESEFTQADDENEEADE